MGDCTFGRKRKASACVAQTVYYRRLWRGYNSGSVFYNICSSAAVIRRSRCAQCALSLIHISAWIVRLRAEFETLFPIKVLEETGRLYEGAYVAHMHYMPVILIISVMILLVIDVYKRQAYGMQLYTT